MTVPCPPRLPKRRTWTCPSLPEQHSLLIKPILVLMFSVEPKTDGHTCVQSSVNRKRIFKLGTCPELLYSCINVVRFVM